MDRKKYKITGQITIEASIVVPLIILVVAFFIYIGLYIHDVVSIRSRAYSIGIEYAIDTVNEEKADIGENLFVIRPTIEIEEEVNNYSVKISYFSKGNRNFINKIISKKEADVVKIQKTMSRKILYSTAAIAESRKGKE